MEVRIFYLWRGDTDTAFFKLSQKPLCWKKKPHTHTQAFWHVFLLLIRTTLANWCFHSLWNNSNMTKTFQVNRPAKGIPVASAAKELNKILQRTNHVLVRGELEPEFPVYVYVTCTGSANHSATSLPNVLDSEDFTNHKSLKIALSSITCAFWDASSFKNNSSSSSPSWPDIARRSCGPRPCRVLRPAWKRNQR